MCTVTALLLRVYAISWLYVDSSIVHSYACLYSVLPFMHLKFEVDKVIELQLSC